MKARQIVCDYVLRWDGATPIKCAALAARGSLQCPIHRAPLPDVPRRTRKVSRAVDQLLPWTLSERVAFEARRRKQRDRDART